MTRKKSTPSAQIRDPHLAHVIEQNIHTIVDIRQSASQQRSKEERLADAITAFSGQMYFVYFHVIWFGLWIPINMGWFGLQPFDPFPFGLLTMIVSLEAIFLATFVLISQNRLSAEADRRADLDLQIGLLTEHELTRALKMLDAIQDNLGIENNSDQDLLELEKEVNPKDVLKEMDLIQRRMNQKSK